MANAPNTVQLFEVNLISDQVSILLRRRTFQQLSGIATVVMLAAGTALALVMAMHLTTAFGIRSRTQSKMAELESLQKVCADLDRQKEMATSRANAIAPLLPIARQRVAWAPKLAGMAAALPPGTGVSSIQATQNNVFVARTSTGQRAAPFAFAPVDEAGLPQMSIAILCQPTAGIEDNLSLFVERLKKDEGFMNKFDVVQLTAMEQDSWLGKPMEVLHIRAQGIPK